VRTFEEPLHRRPGQPEPSQHEEVAQEVEAALGDPAAQLSHEIQHVAVGNHGGKAVGQPDAGGRADVKIARALDLAIELGDLTVAKERLGALRAERARMARAPLRVVAELEHPKTCDGR
jgi:hypothetical protein